MELHRLDGIAFDGVAMDGVNGSESHPSGLDNIDIQDVDFETLDEGEFSGHQLNALEALGYVQEPEIAYEILDEDGNVVMYADAEENLYVLDGLGDLGFFKKVGRGLKKASRFVSKKVVRPVSRKVIRPVTRGISKAAKFTGKKILKPAVKTFNRFLNPATILLRNGFLLAMKINLMNVAKRLRFGYLSDTEARRRGMSMSGFSKLKGAVSKANKIYELAGGKSSNLKKAILTGKGNKDRKVTLSGFELGNPYDENEGFADEFERLVVEMDPEDVEALLEGTMEIDGLGAVATGSAIAAASGAVATVSKLLDKITGVFDKVDKGVTTVTSKVSAVKKDVSNLRSRASNIATRGRSITRLPSTIRRSTSSRSSTPTRIPTVRRLPSSPSSRGIVPTRTSPPATSRVIPSTSRTLPAPISTSVSVPTTIKSQVVEEPGKEPNFFQKNKTPLLIGTGVIVVGGVAYYAVKKSKGKKKPKSKSVDGLPNGVTRGLNGRFQSTKKKSSTKKKKTKKPQKKLVKTALL